MNLKDWPNTWAQEIELDGSDTAVQVIDTVVGALGSVSRFGVPNAATADLDFANSTGRAIRVLDVWFVKTGGAGAAGNTVQLKSTANAITNALDTNVAINVLVRAGEIQSANHTIAAGGVLRITNTKAGGNSAGILYVAHVPI